MSDKFRDALEITTTMLAFEAHLYRERGEAEKAVPLDGQVANNRALLAELTEPETA